MLGQAVDGWIGLRLDVERPCESFITDQLGPWLKEKEKERSLRRWFFLRYSEGGFHLRLRMQPARGYGVASLIADLDGLRRAAAPPFEMIPQIYDRDVLAFGKTRESVLAELLYSNMSAIAVDLMTNLGTRVLSPRRWVFAAATVAALMSNAIPQGARERALREWDAFIDRAIRELGIELHPLDATASETRLRWIVTALPTVAAILDSHSAARRAVALLRRTRERGDFGRFVATHGVHIFCNEMGLSFQQERYMTRALSALWTGARPCVLNANGDA